MSNTLTEILGIKYPIIVAPMFLVSNEKMILEALEFGVTAAFPAMNYRNLDDLENVIKSIKSKSDKPFGVNLIVNKSNLKYEDQLNVITNQGVAFIITSLGSPEETIKRAKEKGIKVFCDVTDASYAMKVEKLGADAVIAVNNQAGGHCGALSKQDLIAQIKSVCSIPIISAGGIGTSEEVKKTLDLNIAGLSIGTVFLASTEAQISAEYKQALIDYGAKDIVLTTKISGTHLTVINTPYVQSLGTKPSFLERILNKNKTFKKYIKLFLTLRGMRAIEKATFKSTYQTIWCAGPSIEYIDSIRPMKEILKDLVKDL